MDFLKHINFVKLLIIVNLQKLIAFYLYITRYSIARI